MDNTTSCEFQDSHPLNPDDTWAYLDRLDPRATGHCFQVFDDRGRDGRLARTLHGPLGALIDQLTALNQRGAGIFVTVNEVKPGCPRTAPNIIRVRACFADADNPANLPEVEAAIARLGLAPSIVVESSPGKRHFYWLVDDCPLEEFSATQKRLASVLGTDPAVCDLPRVLRVPGFYHHKGTPFLVRLVHVA